MARRVAKHSRPRFDVHLGKGTGNLDGRIHRVGQSGCFESGRGGPLHRSPPGIGPGALDQSRGPADTWYVLASILVAVLVDAVLALGLLAIYTPSPVDTTDLLPGLRPEIRPEPAERLLYLLGLACIPTLPTAVYGLLRWLGRRPTPITAMLERPRWLLARDAVLVLGAAAWLHFLSRRSHLSARMAFSLACSLLIVVSGAARLAERGTPPRGRAGRSRHPAGIHLG